MQIVSISKMLAFCKYRHITKFVYPSHFLGQQYVSLCLHQWQCPKQQPHVHCVHIFASIFAYFILVACQSNFDNSSIYIVDTNVGNE